MHHNIIRMLTKCGYEAYFVGGCVRDELLGHTASDHDVATNATPDEIADVFKGYNVDAVGKNFGVMIVEGIEVATFRTESYQVPGKPDVTLASLFQEDASRRDFTINAMAKDIHGRIIDYFGGQADIKQKLIRAVGNPKDRFHEDPSRILRGLYLASRLNFRIEQHTFQCMQEEMDLLQSVPNELVGKILMKVLAHNCLHRFMNLLRDSGALKYVFPELCHTINLPQNPKYHNSCVFDHILRVVESAEKNHPCDSVMLLSAVFHDVAKGLDGIRGVNKEGQPNDIGHEEAGAPIAEKALIRLQFGKDIASQVSFIVRFHGIRFEENPKTSTVKKAIRRMAPYFKSKEDLQTGIARLYQFMDCDADGFAPLFGKEIKQNNQTVWERMKEILKSTIFYRSELPINGNDLIEWGFKGKQVGEVLNVLVQENLQSMEQIKKRIKKMTTNS